MWNWQLAEWPNFFYDPALFAPYDKEFLLESGHGRAFLKYLSGDERNYFVVEMLSAEGIESSRIEGEILQRESLQSSIRKHFGCSDKLPNISAKEAGMAQALCSVYAHWDAPLTHEMLLEWHSMIFGEWSMLTDCGRYRTRAEPMQIISGRTHKIHFEAPPSKIINYEMTRFIEWFNKSRASASVLGRAAHAHVYFESIHPFEDGNGRIGRMLIEKVLSQGIGHPTLLAVSKSIEKHKKSYFEQLAQCNRTLNIEHWVTFCAQMIVHAQADSMQLLHFLVAKSRILGIHSGMLNSRQEKVVLKMFAAGPQGFVGDLTAEKYLAITKTSRATATRDLADLVEKGILKRTGERRHARYRLNLEV